MMAGWDAGDELPGFDRTKGAFVRYADGKGWETVDAAGSKEGTGIFAMVMMDAAGAGSLRVFPNPATTGFYVYLPATMKNRGKYVLNLYDLHGRLMVSREVSDGYYFMLDGELAAGTYVLRVMQAGVSVGSKKIVVVRP